MRPRNKDITENMSPFVTKILTFFSVLAIVILIIISCLSLLSCTDSNSIDTINSDMSSSEVLDTTFDTEVSDRLMSAKEYVVSDLDLQNPELPTGCEATALATLLRMNGIDVTKTEVADAMPKTLDGSDFVNKFWGSPYDPHGWACMAPCSVDTAKLFLNNTKKTVSDLTGTPLVDLPTPSAVWVTIDMEEPIPSRYEQDGYRLMENPHCLVITKVTDTTVITIDPLVGEVEYPFSKFKSVYNGMGLQAVFIS